MSDDQTLELLSDLDEKRVLRLVTDARKLKHTLSLAQIRNAKTFIEEARDVLSDVLDRVDGKR
jgi:hypothetical protein